MYSFMSDDMLCGTLVFHNYLLAPCHKLDTFLNCITCVRNTQVHCINVAVNVLSPFVKLQNATLSLVMSVRMEQLGSNWTDFHEI